DITQKALIVTATDAARTYDGTNWTGGNGVSYSGFITGEDATALGGTLTYGGTAQDSRNAGTYTLSASGLTATNYAITYAAGSLVTSKKAVTLTGLATSKVYDGGLTYTTTADDLTSLSSQLGVSGDTITAATQAYTDRNVGTGKTVTLSSATISDGNSGNNYTITYANGSSGAITKLNVTVADITAANKTYSGTTAATLSAGSASITGKVSGDALNVDATGLSGSFDTKSVGTGKTVNYTGIALSGADVGNYNLTSSTGTTTADISKLDVTVADITALNKTYDRTTDATMSTSSASITGKVAGDALNVDATGLSGTFDTWNAGNGKTVSYTGVALSGADAGNYNLTSSTGTTTANITPRSLTVSGITAANKDYDGTTSVALSVGTAAFSGVLGADVVTITPDVIGGSFADKNAGTSKAINLTGVTLSGTEASNYTLDSVVGVTADIAPVALQIAANDMTYAYNGTNFSNGNGVTYTGFVNGETSGVLDGTLAYDGTSQGAKNAGSYTLSASGLTASNYTIEYVDGALIITPKALMMTGVTATDKIYDGNTSATVSGGTLNGLVGTETLNVTKTGMFDTPDAGTGKTVRVMFAMADGINGGLASNYTLDDTTTTASITSEVTLPTNPTPPPTNPPPPPAPPPPGPTPPSDPIDTGTGTSPGTPSGNDTNTDTTPDGNDPNTGLIPGGDDTNTGTTPDSNNPDSNNPDPDTSTRNNPDGSTTTTTTAPDGTDTETTTAPDGKTTTTATSSEGGKTTVTTNPDGSTTATGTEPDGTTITSTVYPDGTTSVSTTNPDGSTTTQVTAPDGRSETTTTNTDGSLKITSVAPDGTLSTSVTYPDGSTTTTTILPDNTVNTNTVNKDGSSEKVTVGTDGGMTKSIMNVGGAVEMTTTNADGSTVKVTISSDGTMVKTTTGTDGTVTRRSEKVNVSGMPVETIGLQLPVAQLTKGFILLEAIWQQQHSEMAVVLSVTGAGGKSLPTTVHYDQATGRLSVNGTSAEVEVLMLDKAGNLRRLKLTVKEGVVNLKEK
ncbi:MAG: YDG domain-containing protein, partial [Methylotenera sp.]|nr:YDG domain-containing protein [Methylotenera sp.]